MGYLCVYTTSNYLSAVNYYTYEKRAEDDGNSCEPATPRRQANPAVFQVESLNNTGIVHEVLYVTKLGIGSR